MDHHTHLPENRFEAGNADRRTGIVQQHQREVQSRANDVPRSASAVVLEQAMPASSAPAQPAELNIYDRLKMEHAARGAALEASLVQIEDLKQRLSTVQTSSTATIARMQERIDLLERDRKDAMDQRNAFGDYTQTLAVKTDAVAKTAKDNAERNAQALVALAAQIKTDADNLDAMIDSAMRAAATAPYVAKETREREKVGEDVAGAAPADDMPAFLRGNEAEIVRRCRECGTVWRGEGGMVCTCGGDLEKVAVAQ